MKRKGWGKIRFLYLWRTPFSVATASVCCQQFENRAARFASGMGSNGLQQGRMKLILLQDDEEGPASHSPRGSQRKERLELLLIWVLV